MCHNDISPFFAFFFISRSQKNLNILLPKKTGLQHKLYANLGLLLETKEPSKECLHFQRKNLQNTKKNTGRLKTKEPTTYPNSVTILINYGKTKHTCFNSHLEKLNKTLASSTNSSWAFITKKSYPKNLSIILPSSCLIHKGGSPWDSSCSRLLKDFLYSCSGSEILLEIEKLGAFLCLKSLFTLHNISCSFWSWMEVSISGIVSVLFCCVANALHFSDSSLYFGWMYGSYCLFCPRKYIKYQKQKCRVIGSESSKRMFCQSVFVLFSKRGFFCNQKDAWLVDFRTRNVKTIQDRALPKSMPAPVYNLAKEAIYWWIEARAKCFEVWNG